MKNIEKRDLYDINRVLTGKTIFKGDSIPDNNYIVVVLVFIQNSDGKFLIQKRSKIKNAIIIPREVPKKSLNIAPVYPIIAETSKCNKIKILAKSIGLKAVMPTIIFSIG